MGTTESERIESAARKAMLLVRAGGFPDDVVVGIAFETGLMALDIMAKVEELEGRSLHALAKTIA